MHQNLPERESPRGEAGLHRRSPSLSPKLQRAVRADEVVVASQELEMVVELVLGASMRERSPSQIGRALSDGQIQPFDERRVQGRRVLGVGERLGEPPRRAQAGSAFNFDDAIVSSRLQHLAIQNRGTKDTTDDFLIELESVGDDQGQPLDIHAVHDGAHKRERVAAPRGFLIGSTIRPPIV